MGGWSLDDDEPNASTTRAAENAVRQARRLKNLTTAALADIGAFNIDVDIIRELHQLAMDGLVEAPGEIREADNEILGSVHQPPPWQDVPRHLRELCDYLNGGPNRDPIHLAAFALWRLNWIHPFLQDGNGRTARALSYLVLCISFGRDLPGHPTLVETMCERPFARLYREGLDAADLAYRKTGRVDVTKLEKLIFDLVTRQLKTAS